MNLKGLGDNMSLRQSVLVMMFGWTVMTVGLAALCIVFFSLNHYPILEVTVMRVFLDWHATVGWTMWFICMMWGLIAVYMPSRPRAVKKAALTFFMVLIVLHAFAHATWISVMVFRCHNFFRNMLVGNFLRDSVEVFVGKFEKDDLATRAADIATTVTNIMTVSAVYGFLMQVPPLLFVYWMGMNWVITTFFLGLVPCFIILTGLPLVLSYRYAVHMGGNGTENCEPSRIPQFYSLSLGDRRDVRAGIRKIRDFDDEIQSQSREHSSFDGTSSDDENHSGIIVTNKKKRFATRLV